jgi:hypothetical protein
VWFFNLCLPDDSGCPASCHRLVFHPQIVCGGVSVSVFSACYYSGVFLFWVASVLHVSGYQSFIRCASCISYFHNVFKGQTFKKIYLVVLGFELRVLYLIGRHSATWATPPTLFLYFRNRVLHLCPDWDPPVYASKAAGMTVTPPCPAFY